MRIVAAAIRHDGAVYTLPAPARHHHIMRWMQERSLLPEFGYVAVDDFGFVASDMRYVRRKPAMLIAQAAGQIIRPASGGYQGPDLYSEDVW